jgi:phage virion morphogenesis protein
MSDLKPFDDRLAGLIASLSPAGRRKLAGEIAKQLRTAQQQRIKQQKAPDGSPYQARKRQPLRAKKGRIKRAPVSISSCSCTPGQGVTSAVKKPR